MYYAWLLTELFTAAHCEGGGRGGEDVFAFHELSDCFLRLTTNFGLFWDFCALNECMKYAMQGVDPRLTIMYELSELGLEDLRVELYQMEILLLNIEKVEDLDPPRELLPAPALNTEAKATTETNKDETSSGDEKVKGGSSGRTAGRSSPRWSGTSESDNEVENRTNATRPGKKDSPAVFENVGGSSTRSASFEGGRGMGASGLGGRERGRDRNAAGARRVGKGAGAAVAAGGQKEEGLEGEPSAGGADDSPMASKPYEALSVGQRVGILCALCETMVDDQDVRERAIVSVLGEAGKFEL